MNGRSIPKEKDKPKKLRKKPIKKLKKELDNVFSEYIRKRDKGKCCACGVVKDWKYQQNGHYISRSYISTRYDERNCNCECLSCNVFKKGNMPAYTLFLQRKYGNGIIETLYSLSKVIVKNFPYEQLIKTYRDKIAIINKELGNNF